MIVQTLLGSEPAPLSTLEVGVRAFIVVGFAMVAVRVASRRYLSEAAPFDTIVGVALGTILSWIVNGPSSMVPTVACAVLLLLIQWLAGRVSWRDRRVGDFVRGEPITPAPNSRWDVDALRREHVSEPDLDQALRFWGGASDLRKARVVTLERSGHISVVRRR